MDIRAIHQMLTTVISEVCEEKTLVDVSLIDTKSISIFQIRVAQPDLKWVIGRNGKFISAVRTLFTALGKKNHRTIIVELIEEDGQVHGH